MRAAFMERFGPPDVIRYGPLPPPRLGPGEVLVDVAVTAVNHVDTFVRSGAWRTPVPMPFVVGRDMAGEVAAVGADIEGFAVGDRVWCSSLGYAGRQGAAADQVSVAAERLYHLPRGICPADVVAVSHPASTAYLGLFTHGRLAPGETVVVVGAGGNVGGALVLMAAQAGAHVIAVASARDAEYVTALGAVEAVDRRSPKAWDQVRELAPHGVDLYVDTAAQNDLGTAVDLLARRGRIVLLSGLHTRPVLPVGPLYVKDASVVGFAISQASSSELADAAAGINRLLAEGRLRPRRIESLPLSDTAEAHRRLEAGEVRGKFVLHTEGSSARPAGDLTNPAPVFGHGQDAAGRLSRMTTSVVDKSPLFELSADIHVAAAPEEIYAVVSDLPRSGEWSPECQGGEWTEGEPSAVGSVFRGENLRSEDVVGWAPLVRGTWHTECRITEADPGRTFRWMMLSHVGGDQESIWGFDIEPADGGAVLTHHFRMGKATAGIHKICADLDEDKRARFVDEWTAKLAQDLKDTLRRIKGVIEK